MRFFAYILSLYVLVLTTIPCVDVQKDDNLHKIELENSASEHHNHETDNCSPFCTCDCCVSPIIYQANNLQLNYFSLAQNISSEYKSTFITSLFATIWQPPKLS